MAKADDGRMIKDEGRVDGQLPQSQVVRVKKQRTRPRRSWSRWAVSNLARIAAWYTIITVMFRCPSDSQSLAATSPAICRPYLSTKSLLDPFVGPYYDTYASPYVEKARPYVDTVNTRVIRPATVLAINNYNKYAAPQVSKAQEYTWSEWEKRGLPQFQKAQNAAQQIYNENLAPHVDKASEVTSPYYKAAKENAFNVHENHIMPAIAYSHPHLRKIGTTTQKFLVEKALPGIQYAWTNLVILIDGTIWPFVKGLYAHNVRPQLVMIGERIAKYQEGRKMHSAMEQVDQSMTTSLPPDTVLPRDVSSTVETTSSTITTSSTETSSSTSARVAATEKPQIATDETITEDLVKWQKKFAVAADKGTDDLKERIQDIITSMTESGISEGQGLATALEKTSEFEIASIKAKINNVVSHLPVDADAAAYTAAEDEILNTIRASGAQIKTRAKNVRAWSGTFKQDLRQRVELTIDSTLQVLDDIRDLGLQEIGMRWAWMEGVTYKHWQKYHDLKKKFADWRSEVRQTALSQPALSDAHEQADKLLDESMAVTEDAARELVRLRDVTKWKLAARDATDDFDSRAIPSLTAAVSAASSVAGSIKEALVGSSQGTVESLASAVSGPGSGMASSVSSAASDLSESASSAVLGSTGTMESLSSKVSSSASDLAKNARSSASSAAVGTSTGSAKSLASTLSEQYSHATGSVYSMASSATAGPSNGAMSSASSIADSISLSASSAVASASASAKLKKAVDDAGQKVADFTSSLTGGS
ncbi:hypothetical protein LTR64_002791 [Lithohypha guttulata]|uniref:uncharacterized protein n=1 Tax=Lithohypha guttulata TaxID=1690604 RepID=UPI002DE09448|nr:hypothetical protein LTR51_000984 [Lithohypha guttulata]